MNKAFIVLPLAFACATQFANAAPTDAERIALIEQELAVLKEASQAESIADRITVNGFFTGKMGVADNKAGYNGYDTDVDFSKGSKLGLQGTFLLTEQTKVVAQLVARGEDNWDSEMEWAFLSHDFDNGFTARIGRLRLPLFMYSDYLDVGYAQPWATPPSEVYDAVPVTSYNGVDGVYNIDLGETLLTLQASYGEASNSSDTLNADFSYDNIMGVSALISYENWAVRTTYFETKLSSETIAIEGLPAQPFTKFDNNKGKFAGVGLSYDDGQFLAISEYTLTEVEGTYSDTKAGYLTLGYRVNAFTPYVSYAFLKTTDNSDRAPKAANDLPNIVAGSLFNWQRDTYSIGTRYDLGANLSLKADVSYTNNFSDTNGGIIANTATKLDDSILYTISFDAVF